MPAVADNAIIANGGTAQIVGGDFLEIGGLQLTNGSLTTASDGNLNMTGAFSAGSATGTGSLTMGGTSLLSNFTAGEFILGATVGGNANVELNDSAEIAWAGNFGSTNGGTADVTLNDSSRITVSTGEFFVGNSTGHSTITANDNAQIVTNNWTVIGRWAGNPGATGTLTLNGGASLTKSGGGNLVVGDIGSPNGTLNVNDQAQVSINGEAWIGNGAGANGHVVLSGTTASEVTASMTVNNWVAVGRGGGTGTLEVGGSAIFTHDTAGNFVVAVDPGDSVGTVTVKDSGVLSLNSGTTHIGTANIGFGVQTGTKNGTLNVQDTGTVNVNTPLLVGNGSTLAEGTINVSGGTLTVTEQNFAIGREHGDGTLNVSGSGAVTKTGVGGVNEAGGYTGTNLLVGHLETDTIGAVNQTGGTINNASSLTVIGDTGTATWSASGGAANLGAVYIGFSSGSNGTLTLSGTANYAAGDVILSSNGAAAGGTGALRLNGGTLTATSIREGAGNAGTVRFDGGTVRAAADSVDFLSGFETSDVTIAEGGLRFDTNAFNVEITMDLVGDGGLTKLGNGALTLSGANAYGGSTLVLGGTLSITTGFLADDANVWLVTESTLDLDFSGTDTVTGLNIDGVWQPVGTYGAIGSDADFESALFSGDGILNVTSPVPEPGTLALLITAGGLGGLAVARRRRITRDDH